MKRKLYISIISILLIAVLTTPCFTAAEKQPEPAKLGNGLAQSIDAVCKSNNVVGMSMAVFRRGEIIYTQSYGYADRENKIPASDNTKYRSASISKPVTFMGAMMLVERESLNPDAPISGIIGINLDNNAKNPNTTRHLMTHTSTIGDTNAYLTACETFPFPTLKGLMGLGGIFTANEPGKRYQYSNFGAGLVSAVIESVTKQRFHAYMDENIFKKLGLDAGYVRTYIKDAASIANIYQGGALAYVPRTWGRTERIYDGVPLGQQYLIGQCELIISAPDLAKLGIILAGDGSVDGVRILSGDSVKEMNRPHIKDSLMRYGLGLRMNDHIVEGRTITGHPGQALGMIGGLYFDSSDETGVAVLTNGCSINMQDNGVYRINNEIIRAVYKHLPVEAKGEIKSEIKSKDEANIKAEAKTKAEAEVKSGAKAKVKA